MINNSSFPDIVDGELPEDLRLKVEQTRRCINATLLRLDTCKRQARANQLVVSGVPKLENENMDNIYDNICNAIDFDGKDLIEACFRLPIRCNKFGTSSRHQTPSIMLKFQSYPAKRAFFKQYISKINLCAVDIGFSTCARIYINENLTKRNFEILRMARQLKANNKILQYNTSNGQVFIKLDADSDRIFIDSKEHLNSLILSRCYRRSPRRVL